MIESPGLTDDVPNRTNSWQNRQVTRRKPDADIISLFDVEPEPTPPAPSYELPPGLTAAALVDQMREAGAPPEILEHMVGFGDDLQALVGWMEQMRALEAGPATAELLAAWGDLTERGVTALDAELFGFDFLAEFTRAADGADISGPLGALIDDAGSLGGPSALAMTRVMAHLGPPDLHGAANAAANRIAATGVKDRPWVRKLVPATWVDARGYVDPTGTQQTIATAFDLAGRTHVVMVLIDHQLGGGIKDCWVTDDVHRLFSQLRLGAIGAGMPHLSYSFRECFDILRAAVASPTCPADPDQIEDVASFLPLLLRRMMDLGELTAATEVVESKANPVHRKPVRAKRTTDTIHRLKVTLRGTTPPIWRRLEVASTATLAELSDVIQAAFGWSGEHLHRLETAQDHFEDEKGPHDERARTLGSVATRTGSKLTYTYDFGDDWRHLIVVESIGPRDVNARYPRAVAGRQAAPPEDCGGPGGYYQLLSVLADPEHDDFDETLEWLGIEEADEWDANKFDVDELN